MRIITKTLPFALVGHAYSVQLQAIDGVPPYTWVVTVGALPSGFALGGATGIISAATVPNIEPAAYTFTVQCTDGATVTDTQAFILTVFPGSFERTPVYLLDSRILALLNKAVLPDRALVEQHFARSADGYPHLDVDVEVPAWLGGGDESLRAVLDALAGAGGASQAIAEPDMQEVDPTIDGTPINSHDYPVLLARDTEYTTQRGINSGDYSSLAQSIVFIEDVYNEINISVKLQRIAVGVMPGDTVTVALHADAAGVPGALIASNSINVSDIDNSAPEWYLVVLDTITALPAATYHIVVSASYGQSVLDYVAWCSDEIADYAFGTAEAYSIGGAAWVAIESEDFTFMFMGSYNSVDFLMEVQIDGLSYAGAGAFPTLYYGLREPDTLSVVWNTYYSSQLTIITIFDAPGDVLNPFAFPYQIDSDNFITGNHSPGMGGGHVGDYVTLLIGHAYQPVPLLPTDVFNTLFAVKKTLSTITPEAFINFGIPAASTAVILAAIDRLQKRAGRAQFQKIETMVAPAIPGVETVITLAIAPAYPTDTEVYVGGVKMTYGALLDFYVVGNEVRMVNNALRYVLEEADEIEIIYYTEV